MRITVTTTIDVDTAAWATEYGLPADQVPADVLKHLGSTVQSLVEDKGEQLGLFAVHAVTTEIDAEWASPPCAPVPGRSRQFIAYPAGPPAGSLVHASVLLGGCGAVDVGERVIVEQRQLQDTTCPTCRNALIAAGTVAL